MERESWLEETEVYSPLQVVICSPRTLCCDKRRLEKEKSASRVELLMEW